MTSEMDIVSNGMFEAKADLKQIAVSSANLTPDESGLAPLEKQGAFIQANQEAVQPVQPQEPVIATPQAVVQEAADTMVQPQELAPALANPVNTGEAPQATITTEASNVVTPTEAIDNIDYKKPEDDGILTNPAVDVVGTTGLDQMNISEFVDKSLESLKEPEIKEEVVQPEVTKMEMPVMDQEIKAQEPVGQDNRLFEGTPIEPAASNDLNTVVGDTPFAIPTIEESSETIKAEEPTVPSGEQIPEDATQKIKDDKKVDSANVDNLNPVSEFDDHVKMPDEFSIPTFEQSTDVNELNPIEEVHEEPIISDIPSFEEPKDVEKGIENKSSIEDKLDQVLTKLDIIIEITKDMKVGEEKSLFENTDSVIEEPDEKSPELSSLDINFNTPIEGAKNEITPFQTEMNQDETIAPEIEENNIDTPMMKIDEEQVHGKFI